MFQDTKWTEVGFPLGHMLIKWSRRWHMHRAILWEATCTCWCCTITPDSNIVAIALESEEYPMGSPASRSIPYLEDAREQKYYQPCSIRNSSESSQEIEKRDYREMALSCAIHWDFAGILSFLSDKRIFHCLGRASRQTASWKGLRLIVWVMLFAIWGITCAFSSLKETFLELKINLWSWLSQP